jgi:hypothetical protein
MPKPTPKKTDPMIAPKSASKKVDSVVAPRSTAKKIEPVVAPKPVAKKVEPVVAPKPVAKKVEPVVAPKPVAKKVEPVVASKPVAKTVEPVVAPKVAVKRIDPVVDFLRRLNKDDPKVMPEFVKWAVDPIRSPKEVERIHEFVEEAEHRIRNSRSRLDRVAAAQALLSLFREHSRRLGINERFLATICGALCTYFQNRKIWDPAIESCEFLVGRAIPDEDGVGFHKRLDWLYRQRARRSI